MKRKRAICRLIGHEWRKKRYRVGILGGWVAEEGRAAVSWGTEPENGLGIVAAGGWCAPAATVYDLPMGPTWYRRCKRCGKSKAVDS